jgi:metallo-beta-lactamase family protein
VEVRIGFYGGVGEVTGSRHLVETDDLRLLLDCGLFQGHRKESIDKNRTYPFDAKTVDTLLLSHAHIDHCGSIPLLVKNGFQGKIHCTEATQEIVALMLMDSAHLQENDALFFNKIHATDKERIEPLYTKEDVKNCLDLFQSQPYETWVPLSKTTRMRFHNAGHVLGSAMIEVEATTTAGLRRLFFTGDLGRRKALLMDSPRAPRDIDYLLIESTYGDRLHQSVDNIEGILKTAVQKAIAENGKILIPSFALERTQEIIVVLEKMIRHKQIPLIPVIVDSPMAISITEIFQRHLDGFSFSPELKDFVAREGDPFDFKALRYCRTSEESQALNTLEGPAIILSASGMCEGGRILHHLRNQIDKDSTQILLVGYQAEGTLGRRLQQGAKKVRIFGMDHSVWAQVQTLHTFSAHADRDDLLWFITSVAPRPKKVFLVHGDPRDRIALAGHLQHAGLPKPELPEFGETFELP